jgi:ribose transport system ATP-binding protein
LPLLQIEGISKGYPGVTALSGIDMVVEGGEVHALLGENGAGKSTLMKVIAGSISSDRGGMVLAGKPYAPASPDDARARGIGIVYQELSLVPSLTVGENVLLGRWPMTRISTVDWEQLYRRSAESLALTGFEIDPRTRTDRLGMAERQLVEIAKALASADVKVLLLDEPTSALSERESTRLFQIIDELKQRGVAIVYVSHRLKEILRIADRVTVLRDGRRIDTVATRDVDEGRLAVMMVGHELGSAEAGQGPRELGGVALRTAGLGRPPRLEPVDLEVREGEVVAVFGLVGAGRTRLARALFGLEPATQGEIWINGGVVAVASPADAIAHGMGYLGEDRASGLVPRISVAANVTLATLDRASRGPLLDFGREREVASRFVDELSIRLATVDMLAETLSGGNQQKVLLARWMCSEARILLLDDPTRGIDVGGKQEVFRLVRRLASTGVAVLYLTSEIKEAKALADRVLVMSNGRVVSELDPATPEEEIMAAAGGAHG